MSASEAFLNADEERKIIDAIRMAEERTSGEIRVHIEEKAEKDALTRAKELFVTLEMEKTSARNGVLFYIDVQHKQFAIVGDEGIDRVVPNDFWECTKDVVLSHFAQKQFADGLIQGILRAGEKLQTYFPALDKDVNELPNEINRS